MVHVLNSLPTKATSLMRNFHKDVYTRARRIGAGIATLHTLQQQLQVYEDVFKDLATTTRDSISARQREINREFVPIIEEAMRDAYIACVAACGPGSFMVMKAAMTGHVDRARNSMFTQSTENVRKQLNKMLQAAEEAMSNRADEVFVTMRRDYRSILGGQNVPQGEVMPKWAKEMRKEVMKLIDSVEEHFTRTKKSDSEAAEEDDIDMDTLTRYQDEKQPCETDKPLKNEEPDSSSGNIDGFNNDQSKGSNSPTRFVSCESGVPDADIGTNTDEKPYAASESPPNVTSVPDATDNIGHLNDHEEHKPLIVPHDTETAGDESTTIPTVEVEDSECDSAGSATPTKVATVKDDDATEMDADDHVTKQDKNLADNFLDW